jgi:hypothetical protein
MQVRNNHFLYRRRAMTAESTEEAPLWPGAIPLGNAAQESVFEALGAMPELFFAAVFLRVILSIFNGFLAGMWTPSGTVWLREALQQSPHYVPIGLSLVSGLVRTIITACVAVAVHRFILLRRRASGLDPLAHRYTWTFAFWAIGLSLFHLVVRLPFPTLLRVLLIVALSVIGVRLSLIFPAVAIEAQSRNGLDRLRESWNRTRGKVILLFFAYIIAIVPFVVLFGVAGFAVLFVSVVVSDAHPTLGMDLIALLFLPVGGVAAPSFAAAVASHAYRAAVGLEAVDQAKQPPLSCA